MTTQLPLSLRWQDQATFNNFYVGENSQVLDCLRNLAQGPSERFISGAPGENRRELLPDNNRCAKQSFAYCQGEESRFSPLTTPHRGCLPGTASFIYLYGAEGSGLTHLLQASCQAVNQQGRAAAYLPLASQVVMPQMLEGMESLDLLCLDDVQAIAGNPLWEEALFHCYNRLLSSQTRLVIVGHAALKQMPWVLPDLLSRLSACVIFQVKTLSDEQKILALQQRAKNRSLELPTDVGQYLLNRYPRDMRLLFNTLEKLDRASLAAQRRLTVPFVKMILSS